MGRFVMEERRREPAIRYSELLRRVMAKFRCARSTAERGITAGTEMLRTDFMKSCADAPRAIFDLYMQIVDESMRAGQFGVARAALNDVRDTFGMRGALNIHIHNGGGPPPDSFAPLSVTQLEALAALDAAPAQPVIDVPGMEEYVDVVDDVIDVLGNEEPEEVHDDQTPD